MQACFTGFGDHKV